MKMTFGAGDLEEKKNSTFLGVGKHAVKITDIASDTSKAGNKMMVLTLSDANDRSRREFFPLTDAAKWKIAQLAVACGYTKEHVETNGLDLPGDLQNKTLNIIVDQVGTRKDAEGKEWPAERTTFVAGDGSLDAGIVSPF